MIQGLAVLCGGHIGGHIVLENVRYFTVNCDFSKIVFRHEKSPKPLKNQGFSGFFHMAGAEELVLACRLGRCF